MKAVEFQRVAETKLLNFFPKENVVLEWPISKAATDALKADKNRYSPRLDIAVGIFNIDEGDQRDKITKIFNTKAPKELKLKLSSLSKNNNPRCVLGIEVVFSGSSKHILGDITNAGMMGLYGIVVASPKELPKVTRIFEYLKKIVELKKGPEGPSESFKNVIILSTTEFLELLENT